MKAGNGQLGQLHHDHGKTILEFMPGPVKIKDGLFLGDELAARDIEFIISNKVTHVINTVSRQVPNLWERFNIHYLSVNWTEKEQNIFDKKNNAVNTVFQFIEEAMEQGQSCLVHSLYGKSRASAVMVAYLMKKYSWSMSKCLEFIASKKQNLQIRNNYMKQLEQLEGRMKEKMTLSTDWKDVQTPEEALLTNTLTNSKAPSKEVSSSHADKKHKKRVTFEDKPVIHKLGNQKSHGTTTTYGPSKNKTPSKSILKGFEDPPIEKEEEGDFSEFQESQNNPKNIINNINGQIVHVTVNNFITSDKKTEQPASKVSTRPYSSDQKQREKEKKNSTTLKKTLLNDPGTFGSSLRSPYDMKMGTKNTSLKTNHKRETTGGRIPANERPQSAKHRTPTYQHNKGREDLMVTNGTSSSSSYSTAYQKRVQGNIKEDLFRRR